MLSNCDFFKYKNFGFFGRKTATIADNNYYLSKMHKQNDTACCLLFVPMFMKLNFCV